MTTITLHIDNELYSQVGPIFSADGLNVAEAVKLFLTEVVRQGKIPFAYTDEDLKASKNNTLVRLVEDDNIDA